MAARAHSETHRRESPRAAVHALVLAGLLALPVWAEDAPLGLTYRDGDTEARVWAPNAAQVELVGEFNGWKPSLSDRLEREAGTGLWFGRPAQRVRGAYGFLINGRTIRRDPYNRAVTPDGQRSLAYDTAAFDWKTDQPVRLPLEDIVMYQLHVGAFHDPQPSDGLPGTFADAVKRLDHVAELGANAVVLLPVAEFNGDHSWGYNPCDPFAVEQVYGGPDGLKEFVRACHARGLAVHLDIVHNHYGPENLDLMNYDHGGALYFYDGQSVGATPWGPRPKFDEPMVRRFIRDNVLMWLAEYRVDGFRWDSTINIRNYDLGKKALPAGASLMAEINQAIHEQFPHAVNIAEDSLGIGNFQGSWDYDFHHGVMSALRAQDDLARDVSQIAGPLNSHPLSMERVIYVDSHDEAGLLNKQTRIASDVSPKEPQGEAARRLCGLGAAITLTAPGIPMIFMGNEMQENGPFHENRPLDWGKAAKHKGLVAMHRDLIRLRRNLDGVSGALKGHGVKTHLGEKMRQCMSYWRWHDKQPADRLVVVLNLSSRDVLDVTVPFPSLGHWMTCFNSEWDRYGGRIQSASERPLRLTIENLKQKIAMPPYSVRIFALSRDSLAAAAQMPAPPPDPSRQLFTLMTSIKILGNFAGADTNGMPMYLVDDNQWEYHGTLPRTETPIMQFVADGPIRARWGIYQKYEEPLAVPFDRVLIRNGKSIVFAEPMEGHYLVRFNEETAVCNISKTDLEPPRLDVRTWTSRKGQRIQAKLVARKGPQATLEQADGRRMAIGLEALSAEDHLYLRRVAHLLPKEPDARENPPAR